MRRTLYAGHFKSAGRAAALAGATAICMAVPSASEAISCSEVPAETPGVSALEGDYDAIVNQGSDLPLALAATGGSTGFAEQGSMWPNAALREWSLTSLGGSEYKIANVRSDAVLGSVGRADRTGTYFDRAGTWTGASTQIWVVTEGATSGTYTLSNKKTGRVLSVRNKSAAVGAAIVEVSPTGAAAELWSFELPAVLQSCDSL